MANPAVDRTKREMVLAALAKLRAKKPMTRSQLFDGYPVIEHREFQKRILASLQKMGVVHRLPHKNPSIVLFNVHNPNMLDSITNSEMELTRLIWPNLGGPSLPAPAMPQVIVQLPAKVTKAVTEPEEEEEDDTPALPPLPAGPPAPTLAPMPDQTELMKVAKEILARQDLILEKVVNPIGENVLWTRDRILELQRDQKKLADQLAQALEILRKLE